MGNHRYFTQLSIEEFKASYDPQTKQLKTGNRIVILPMTSEVPEEQNSGIFFLNFTSHTTSEINHGNQHLRDEMKKLLDIAKESALREGGSRIIITGPITKESMYKGYDMDAPWESNSPISINATFTVQ